MKFLDNSLKTNWKYIAIVVVLGLITGGGVWYGASREMDSQTPQIVTTPRITPSPTSPEDRTLNIASTPSRITQKTEQYIISKVGKEYFEENYILDEKLTATANAHIDPAISINPSWTLYYHEKNIEELLGRSNIYTTIAFESDQNGDIVPDDSATWVSNDYINREESLAIAKKSGFQPSAQGFEIYISSASMTADSPSLGASGFAWFISEPLSPMDSSGCRMFRKMELNITGKKYEGEEKRCPQYQP